MFQCAWCKKENISVHTRSEYSEPICSECVGKYTFWCKQKTTSGKVDELTKEYRWAISQELSGIEKFVDGAHTVRKEELTGRFKFLPYAVGLIMFLFYFLVPSLFGVLITGIFLTTVFGLVYLFAYTYFALLLYPKAYRFIQYLQIRQRAKNAGFTNI